jgi:hypothetical protein
LAVKCSSLGGTSPERKRAGAARARPGILKA